MVTGPLVSVIIPVYNVEFYLAKCIDSILYQTYKNIEVILINDGSKDSSGLICDYYVTKDKRVKAVHKENGGLASARNKGISQCTGEYVTFVDADDWMDLCAIEESVKAALEASADIVLWGYVKEFGSRCKQVHLFKGNVFFYGEMKNQLHRRMVGLIKEELSNPTSTDFFNSAWGKLYRKTLISENKINFISERLIGSEDVFFNIEVFGKAFNVYYLDRLFYHYRQDNPKALTKSHNNTLFPRFLNLFEHIDSYIKENNLGEEYQLALRNRISLSIINNLLSIIGKSNEQRALDKIEAIRLILNNITYNSALKSLELKYMPFYWKAFFILCKYKITKAVFLTGVFMRALR